MQNYYIVSFSGGKDSTAMLLKLIEQGKPIDEIIFCDTGMEFPDMYKHIEEVKKIIDKLGYKFTILKSKYSFDYYFYEYTPNRKNDIQHKGLSWSDFHIRWCTMHLKKEVLHEYYKKLENYNIIEYIGLAYDEQNRKQYSKNIIYPLIEMKMTEKDCLQYCYDNGFDWNGLYTHFNRVSCWCCPLQSLDDLRNLRKYYPELWKKLRLMDINTWRTFKFKTSVESLERRFEFEDKYFGEGKRSYTKDFYKRLKEGINR